VNILIVFDTDISPSAAGGATRMTHTLAETLSAQYGSQVSLAFFKTHKVPSPIQNKIHVTSPIEKSGFETFLLENKIDVILVSLVIKKYLHFIPEIYKIARKHNIKMVQWFHMMPGFEIMSYGSISRFLYAVKKRKQVIWNLKYMLMTGLGFMVRPVVTHFILRPKYRLQYDNCDAYVLLSENFIPDLEKMLGSKHLDKVYAINNSLTLQNTISEEALQQKQKQVLLLARQDEPMKRISLALRIWKKIEERNGVADWNFIVAGRGDDLDYYQYLAKKLQLKRCTIAGFLSEQPYKKSSIFMMTSAWEGWGLTLTEAQQMGVVPVAFNSYGAVYDIIQNGENGIIVPNNDLNAFADALVSLMMNDEVRLQMALRAVTSSNRFSLDKIACKWMDLFEHLLADTEQN
jgi:glycosyltransferase involved in cell wall biosynthesis